MGASLLLEAEVIGARTAHRVLVLHTRDRPFDSPSCVTLETASNVAAAFPSSCARRVVRKEIYLLRFNLCICCSPTTRLINLPTYYSLQVEVLFEVYWFIAIGYSQIFVFYSERFFLNIQLSIILIFLFLWFILYNKNLIIFACHASTLSHFCGIPSVNQTCVRYISLVKA